MYPQGTEIVYSYFEARKGAQYDEVTFFGLQPILKELQGQQVTMESIDAAEELVGFHLGDKKLFYRERWEHILKEHNGRLPVRIKAVPEGMSVPIGNVLMTVENTDPKCFWLTNHLETWLTHVWYASTVATMSKAVKGTLKHFLEETASSDAMLDFMLHDFGMRGVPTMGTAGIGGAGHLIHFKGTDTVVALETAHREYDADYATLGFSVTATEHSVMTAKGREGEAEVIEHLLDTFPTGILSMVSDSYDIYNCVENILGGAFREKILARDGVLVVRPDSGEPVEVVRRLLKIMGERFGFDTNKGGYKLLNPKVRIIWGDGIDHGGIRRILEAMKEDKWAAENIIFGMGGGLLQKVNRDTQRFAFKCSARRENARWFDVYKDPIEGGKASKRGRLKLIRDNDTYKTVAYETAGEDILQSVFENGKVMKLFTFDEVRANALL